MEVEIGHGMAQADSQTSSRCSSGACRTYPPAQAGNMRLLGRGLEKNDRSSSQRGGRSVVSVACYVLVQA